MKILICKSLFPDHWSSEHQNWFGIRWGQVQILACHLLGECPWTSQSVFLKLSFLIWKMEVVLTVLRVFVRMRHPKRRIIPLNLACFMCSMEIISAPQGCCEMLYMKVPGTKKQLNKCPCFWFFRLHLLLTNISPYKISIICSFSQQSEWLFPNEREQLYLQVIETEKSSVIS